MTRPFSMVSQGGTLDGLSAKTGSGPRALNDCDGHARWTSMYFDRLIVSTAPCATSAVMVGRCVFPCAIP